MCLLVVAHGVHPELPLIVAGNRDEFHGRPASDAAWWSDNPDILGGRDLEAGGTWLGVHRSGRFATVTNYRDAVKPSAGFESRGALVTGFLEGSGDPFGHVDAIDGERYAGFNLLATDAGRLVYRSNRLSGSRELAPGIYAVANATLDTPWPKVERIRGSLERLIGDGDISVDRLIDMLGDRTRAPVEPIDDDAEHLPPERLEALSAPFVVMPDYGTRCSTVVLADRRGRIRFAERRFDRDGSVTGQSDFEFEAGG